MKRLLVISLLGACGSGGMAEPPDAAVDIDAVAPDASPPVEATGKVFVVAADFTVTALEGAPVELRRTSDDGVIATATTDAEGAFTVSFAGPADAYLSVETAAYLPTRAYPTTPVDGAQDLLLVVADATVVDAWYTQVGDSFDAAARTMIVAMIGSDGDPAVDATVALAPAPGALAYYDPALPGWNPALAAAPNGFALATTLAATVTITASVGDPRTVPAEAGALTMAVIAPGN